METWPIFRMRRALHMSVLLLLFWGPALRAGSVGASPVIFVESGVAGHGIGAERIDTCMRLLAQEMGVANPLPTIVVIHIDKREADKVGLKNVSAKLRINSGSDRADNYYELWLVGSPTTFEYTYSLAYLLQAHFDLHHPEAEQRAVVERVVRHLDATIAAKAMR